MQLRLRSRWRRRSRRVSVEGLEVHVLGRKAWLPRHWVMRLSRLGEILPLGRRGHGPGEEQWSRY